MLVNKFHYRCVDCGTDYPASEIRYLCPECKSHNRPDIPPKGVLKVIYDYNLLKSEFKNTLKNKLIDEKFMSLLPFNNIESLPNLRVGATPIYDVTEKKLVPNQSLFLKDDSQNPTYSFKDRASAIVSAFAKENGIKTIAAASTGNAGSSLAGICASQNQQAIVFVPEKAPIAKLTQIVMYGAKLVPVKGTYDDAFDLSIEASEAFGWFNRNTAYNPFTIEGKKTVSFEIFQQFNGSLPDFIFVPVGDGVIVSGVYKGFEDLLQLELIDKIPIIVAVQAEGSNNLIANLDNSNFILKPSNTIADSISVDIPRNFHMAKKYLKKYNGKGIEVTDSEILKASVQLSNNTGLFAEPAAATGFAGFLKFFINKPEMEHSKSLVLLTGSGLKDLNAVNQEITMVKSIDCNIESVKKLFHF